MSTLHLHYKSLKDILDIFFGAKKSNVNDTHLQFTKKIHIERIIEFIPTDLCKIINTYCDEFITVEHVKIDKYNLHFVYNYAHFLIDDSYVILDYSNDNTTTYQYISPTITYPGFNDAFQLMNAFMLHKYDRSNYFICPFRKTKYIVQNGVFKNTIIFDDIKCISGLKIFDCKNFRYMIAIIKCILNAMLKYKKRKDLILKN